MFRRRNYFIKKRFQLNFISGFLVLLLLEAALIAGLFMHVSSNTLTTGYSDAILKVQRTSDFFMVSFLLITLIVVVGMGMAGMVVFILLSHRLAGPLYRFERTLKEIEEGDLTTRVNLRRTDQIAELKEALNVLILSLDKRMGRIKIDLIELKKLLSDKSDPETIKKIDRVMDSLKEEIEHFKVSPGHIE